MLGEVPSIILDIGIVAGVFTAMTTALALLWKTAPVLWFRRQMSESLGAWFRDRVQEANADHHEYVRYHLGPNGSTKPVHERLKSLELKVGQMPHSVDWHAPYDDVD